MAKAFVELECTKGGSAYRVLMETPHVATASVLLMRRDPEMVIERATVIEYDWIYVQPAPITQEMNDASTPKTTVVNEETPTETVVTNDEQAESEKHEDGSSTDEGVHS